MLQQVMAKPSQQAPKPQQALAMPQQAHMPQMTMAIPQQAPMPQQAMAMPQQEPMPGRTCSQKFIPQRNCFSVFLCLQQTHV